MIWFVLEDGKSKELNDKDFWPMMRDVLAHDIETLPMERFKVWASVRAIPMVAVLKPINLIIDTFVRADNNPKNLAALTENDVGYRDVDDFLPYSLFDDFRTNMNRVTQLSHLFNGKITQDDLANMETIIELGGGVGDMADIVYKLGFKGKYIIYDFPEVGTIQKYYHNKLQHPNIIHTDRVDALQKADLCLAMYSFTEMPYYLRDIIYDQMQGTPNWLIAFSRHIFGLDNQEYLMNKFVPRFESPAHEMEVIPMPNMQASWDGGSGYLIIKGQNEKAKEYFTIKPKKGSK